MKLCSTAVSLLLLLAFLPAVAQDYVHPELEANAKTERVREFLLVARPRGVG